MTDSCCARSPSSSTEAGAQLLTLAAQLLTLALAVWKAAELVAALWRALLAACPRCPGRRGRRGRDTAEPPSRTDPATLAPLADDLDGVDLCTTAGGEVIHLLESCGHLRGARVQHRRVCKDCAKSLHRAMESSQR